MKSKVGVLKWKLQSQVKFCEVKVRLFGGEVVKSCAVLWGWSQVVCSWSCELMCSSVRCWKSCWSAHLFVRFCSWSCAVIWSFVRFWKSCWSVHLSGRFAGHALKCISTCVFLFAPAVKFDVSVFAAFLKRASSWKVLQWTTKSKDRPHNYCKWTSFEGEQQVNWKHLSSEQLSSEPLKWTRTSLKWKHCQKWTSLSLKWTTLKWKHPHNSTTLELQKTSLKWTTLKWKHTRKWTTLPL